MLYLVALIVPGIAMMMAGKPFQGLLCLVLQVTVIGWIPATIWALMTVSDSKSDKRAKRYAIAAGADTPTMVMPVFATAGDARGRAPRPDPVGPGGMPLNRVQIVGEAPYQAALTRLAGGKTTEGRTVSTQAELRREPGNQYDANAVQVFITNQAVGYLSREWAEKWSPALAARKGRFECQAEIRGGWQDGADVGSWGVDVFLPDLV